ncbi:MAG: Crp/Fnr family transcriptional regulator [Acidobacteria bacterium]|nr:Crp/Fnr family transcriptional regulator [Acidobacteriota bacterium]
MAAHFAVHEHSTTPYPGGAFAEPALFSTLPPKIQEAVEAVKFTTTYPNGAVLFVEGQAPRGIFIVESGRVKLSVCARDGKTLILRIAEPGEVIGVGSAVSERACETTAETQGPCALTFIRQNDLLRLMRHHNEFAILMAEQLSAEYASTCQEIRSLILSDSATEKLARLLLGWLEKNGDARHPGKMKLAMTHEEIAQMIGTSRETVTRLLATFKRKQFIQQSGATLFVRNRTALEALISA